MDIAVYRHILDEVSDGVVVFDKDRQIIYCNPAFACMSGFDAGDLDQGRFAFMQGPDSDASVIAGISAAIDQVIAQGCEYCEDVLSYRKSGEVFWNEVTFKPVESEDDDRLRFVGFFRDITARKRAENRAVRFERDYQFIAENVLSGIIIHNPDSSIRYINPKAREMLGLNQGEAEGKTSEQRGWEILRPDGTYMPREERPFFRAMAEHSTVRGVLLGYCNPSDGRITWALCDAFLATDDNGEVAAVLVSSADVTRLVESEQEVAAYRERFELAARASQDAIFEWNIATGDFFANEAFEKIYGYPPPAIMGPHNLDARSTLDPYQHVVRDVTLEAIQSNQERFSVDHMIARDDGSVGHVIIRAFIVRDDDGTALRVIGTATDVGHLTTALLALEQSEARFRIIADTVSDVLWDHDFETGETWMTPDWSQRLNLDTEQLVHSHDRWMSLVHPADRTRVLDSYNAAIASSANRWELEYQLIGRNRQRVDVAVKAHIMRDADGRPHRVLGNVRDITGMKRQQEGYTRARALEAVGQLTGGVAHDFNNLLMIIQGNAELLGMSKLAPDDAESVALISRAAESAADLTRHLLAFSGQTRVSSNCVDLAQFFDTAWPLLRAGLPESIALTRSLAPHVAQPEVDANSLEQALVNLAMNAKDAMPNGGEIVITAENHEVTPDMVPNALDLKPGRYVMVSVSDSGSGMSSDVQARAFEPYFTTKEFGKGTGLGLSTVYGFAAQSGGTATITSEEGHGTTVNLYLPTCQQCSAVASDDAAAQSQFEPPTEQRRVLVVEDQPEVRAHVVKLLMRLGYEVVSAENAVAALEILNAGQTFDLLFTDIIMPGGMNGQELSTAVKAIDPYMKVLFTSGYPATAFEHLGFDDQNALNLLRKPYKTAELKEAIARTLAE